MITGAGFSPAQRLHKSYEFHGLRKSGKKSHSRHFILYIHCRDGHSRLGLTVSRKIGNAVRRNRVKRLLREYFRRNNSCFSIVADISIIAKLGAADLTYGRICEELKPLLMPIGCGSV